METPPDILAARQNLADLQAGSLRVVAVFVGAVGYLWFILTAWLPTGRYASPASWAGSISIMLTAYLAQSLRRRQLRAASALLVAGSLFAVVCALFACNSVQSASLFIVPIVLGGMLLGQWAVLTLTCLGILCTLEVGVRVMNLPLLCLETSLPLATITLGATASWLAQRNLYTALAWVWNGYEQAHQHEEVARAGQAELRRALKALDEATYRLERTNHMLSVAREQADEANRLKQQFVQTISHELRTPLNLIVGFTELMAESPEYRAAELPPAFLRDLSIVHRNALHLRSLINDVLDLARIEAAQMRLLFEEIDPVALTQEAVETARSLVESRGLVLQTNVQQGLPFVWMDPTRIRQVLFNLLSNAARFTERGSITVSVRRESGQVIWAVADTGPGIPREEIPRIFQEFHQIDAGTRRRHEGAGLGLAISRKFVELHGGRIWVESEVGRGSTFYFALPVQRTELSELPTLSIETPRRPVPSAVQEPLLLAVTRSTAAAALLTHYIQGVRTVAVPDIEEARIVASKLRPDAVLVDQASCQLDPEGLQRLGRSWGLPNIPFLTCPLPGEEALRQRLAVDGYLVKPVSRAALWDVLRPFGEDVDRVLVIDDDEDFALLLTRMLEASPLRRYQVSCASSGHEGLGMIAFRRPDLVFLDMRLPDMNGTQVIEHIRSNAAWSGLPIVVVSAQDEMGDEGTLSGGMAVAKGIGIRPTEVVHWVRSVVSGR